MAPGKAPCRRRSSDSGVEPDRGPLLRDREQLSALSQKKKEQRIALFLSDFDQQAKEHIQEMKKELDSLLQTAEKAFAVELLTMPAAVRKMKRKEVLVKVTTIVEYEDSKHSSAKKITKKHGLQKDVKSLSFHCSATNLKATPKGAKSAGLQQTVSRTLPPSGRVQGMLKRSKSVPQHKSVPFVNIPLADGQTLCTAGGDLRNIDVQLLNQDTVQHIHNLVVSLNQESCRSVYSDSWPQAFMSDCHECKFKLFGV
ncbi:Borealin-2 [Turdus rufiventris]|nr:Borealin-2 [Turdus rufiventris]